MSNFQIIQAFFNLQAKVSYDKTFHMQHAQIAYTQANPSVYENYALVDTILDDQNMQQIEEKFSILSRTPCIYFENRPDLEQNISFLSSRNYSHRYQDSWLFYENEISDISQFTAVKEVKNLEDLEVFIQTFDASYQKNDPQNPYGEVHDFVENTKERWLQFQNTNILRYFIAYHENEPVAVSSLSSFNGFGYISAVGSLQRVRGKGYGKLVSLYAVYISQQMRNNTHFLLTEEGTHPYEFYCRIGFTPKFRGIGMYQI